MFLAEWVLWWWNECLKQTSYLTKADEDNVTHKTFEIHYSFIRIGYPTDVPSHHKQISRLYNLNFTMTVVYLTDVSAQPARNGFTAKSACRVMSLSDWPRKSRRPASVVVCRPRTGIQISTIEHTLWMPSVESALDNLRPWCVLHLIRRIISPKKYRDAETETLSKTFFTLFFSKSDQFASKAGSSSR